MPTPPLRLGGVPEHFNLPWHLALESDDSELGLAGLDLTWEDQPGGTGQMLAGLEAGGLDVVSILTEGTVRAVAAGLAVTIVQVYVESPLQWGVYVPVHADVVHEADLGPCRIAVSRFGSGSHLMSYILAERLGWSIDPERFVVVGDLDGAVEAFRAGTVDLFLWDRFMSRPLVEAGYFRQIGVQPTPWPSFVIAARDEIVADRAAALDRVVDSVIAHAAQLTVRPDGPEEVARRYGLSIDTAKEWFDTTSFAGRGPMDSGIVDEVLATLNRAGLG